jgi:GT2 family glycosyltransferase/glycosyltransferase involved in cell wall biosynthesis/2-polyprenyl-3-methyl-5-hydroxy-6-metoxy-1,4-benzoquinol methylase/uncharacterized coiled-coil protein SlyX
MIIKEQESKIVYSDGEETERCMLEIAQKYPEDLSEDYIAGNSSYTLNNTFSSVRRNILNWYPFRENSKILEVGAGMGAITGLLCDKAKSVTAIEMSEARAEVIRNRLKDRDNLTIISENINSWDTDEKFDYVVFIGVLEYAAIFSDSAHPYDDFLNRIKELLVDDGRLLFAIENRFGLKYWLGGSEDHLQKPFVGISGYEEPNTARTFSKKEIENLLERVGFSGYRFYNVLPDYKFPELIFDDEYEPDYMNLKKVSFTYSKNSSLYADERTLYKDIIENKVFPFFANSFLIEASKDELDDQHVIHVSAKGEVYKDFRVSTIISNDGYVYKVPMHKNAISHIKNIYYNTEYLLSRGVSILPVTLENDILRSKRFKGISAQDVFAQALASGNMELIKKLLDCLKNNLLKSSESVEYNINNMLVHHTIASADVDYGVILQKAFIDMTFYNSFWEDEELLFYDQEWCFEKVPLNFCLYYSLKSAYTKADVDTDIILEQLLDYIGIKAEEIEAYEKLEQIIWSKVLYRQTDFYGEDGYCNRYCEDLTLATQQKQLNNRFRELEEQSVYKEEVINEKNFLITELQKSIDEKGFLITELQKNIDEKGKNIIDTNEIIENKEEAIKELFKAIHDNEKTITQHLQTIRNKEGHINLLLEVEREYEREKNSRAYRFALKLRKFSQWILPKDSKRRFVAGICRKIIKTPKLMLHVIKPKRIIKFFTVYEKEGMEGVKEHYQQVEEKENSKLVPFDAGHFEVTKILEQSDRDISEYELLLFTEHTQPEVSVIIPAYNQFEYTYNCLSAILKNSGAVKYEIILADDCSTDLTTQLEQVVKGITVIHNQSNLRFLQNCNNAAQSARGKYIVFLNNDTQVQENWLQPLVDILENDEMAGMTGSKLVYSDGWLQEAGGIFWKDASAWNYGNRKNPDDPEYNYVKEVDYISGASIMIRAFLWKEIGGFDEQFEPAYYEDSDLAFEVRKHGYKVVYQPLSVVVHFEGVSNGTDLTCGQKSYQVTNQAKFYRKWKEVLEKEHFSNGENVFLAKDRSRFKKQILVVDHYVPHYDRDAGGKCTYMYLLMFVKMGLKVTFIGDNFFKHEPYTTDLNQHGIEVLYGNYYHDNWQKWLKENLNYFDYVYLQRPHISIKYMDIVKQNSQAKVFYFAHDLHHVREYREYLLTKDEEKLKSSEHWKKIEYGLFEKADVGHVVGSYEQDVMQKAFPEKPIRNIPLYIYEDILTDIDKNFTERRDLIYVGGFGHPPNIDAVLWFGREVFPQIIFRYPNIKWHVVGGKVPPEIQKMASDNIIIEGFLSDDDLHSLYRECRMAVVPLRVGAGVKGKVVEAAYYQIPLVTTTIGAEGLDADVGNMVVEDDADRMAELVCGLYEDIDTLKSMSDAGIQFIEKYFTLEKAQEVLNKDL